MNKFLRYSLSLVFALVASVGFAQDIIWSEDFSSYKADAVPAGGDYNYVCVGSGTKIYTANMAGGTSPELLVGKNGGAFSATVKLNGKSGDMNLAFKSNRTDLVVAAENATLGTVTKTGNDYVYPLTIAAGTENITIKFSMTTKSNARLDNIKLYQGVAKKPAGLSWGTSARTVTIGAEDNVFPTLTNANNLEVTYSSSKPEVATIAADGTITLVKAGTTDIKASFAGNDEYEAGEVTYALTVKSGEKVDISNTAATAYTVARAKELIDAGEGLETKVYVKGKVSKASTSLQETYGSLTYNISDNGNAENELTVYGGLSFEGAKFTSVEDIKVGDEVVVYGILKKYNTTYEVDKNNVLISKNGATTNLTHVTLDAAAENAPAYNLAGQQVSKAYKGVVVKAGKKFVQK